MSLISITDAMKGIREITGKDPRSVGASIYVDGHISDEEMSEIHEHIDPAKIERITGWTQQTTRIDL
jgi:mRNA degradation ribonuclease J1/J2